MTVGPARPDRPTVLLIVVFADRRWEHLHRLDDERMLKLGVGAPKENPRVPWDLKHLRQGLHKHSRAFPRPRRSAEKGYVSLAGVEDRLPGERLVVDYRTRPLAYWV